MSRIKIKYILSNEGQLLIGQQITVKGWVRAFRSNRFIQINDGSCLSNIQAVIDFEKYDERIINQITTAAAVSVSGILVASIGTGQSVELQTDAIEIIGAAHPDEVQKTVLQPKKHSLELLGNRLTCASEPIHSVQYLEFDTMSPMPFIIISMKKGFIIYTHP